MAETQHNTEKDLDVKDHLKRLEAFYEKYNQAISTVGITILVIVGGYFGFTEYYLKPLKKEAQSQLFKAQNYFAMDSFDLALNGDGNYLGFLSIIDEYGLTQAATLSEYYAGICFLKKGEFQNAIDHLKEFSSDDLIVSALAQCGIADAYMELGETSNALGYYKSAVEASDNNIIAPTIMKKAAMAYEKNGDYSKAAKIYQKIQNQYPNSNEGRDIEKYIARATARMES